MAAITNSYASDIPQDCFPGLGATFVHKAGDWKHYDSGAHLVRSIEFISTTPGSFLETFSVCGYHQGSIVFHVQFQKELEKAARIYFKSLELDDRICIAHAETPQQRSALFTVLSQHNTLPSEHHELIHKLAHAQNWKEVTPLQADETLASENHRSIYDLARSFGDTFEFVV